MSCYCVIAPTTMMRHRCVTVAILVLATLAPLGWANPSLKLSPPACARALLLVAHPDDEVFFAGEALLGRIASLPGGCRYVDWHVVCVTNGRTAKRRQNFRNSLHVARQFGLAARILEEVWNFEDCNYQGCGDFLTAGDANPQTFVERLQHLMFNQGPWDYVVTHNEDGEYLHLQHIGLHKAVRRLMEELPWGTAPASGFEESYIQPRPQMLVFNPLPELNVSLSKGKQRMAHGYLNKDMAAIRIIVFNSLLRYAENLITVEQYHRPSAIRLANFPSAVVPQGLHFSHAWSWAAARYDTNTDEKQEVEELKVSQAESEVKGMLLRVSRLFCNVSDATPTSTVGEEIASGQPWYPRICKGIRRALLQTVEFRKLLLRMKAQISVCLGSDAAAISSKKFLLDSSDDEQRQERTEHPTATGFTVAWVPAKPTHSPILRCVRHTSRLGRSGSVTMWLVDVGNDKLAGAKMRPKGVWLEVFIARPIRVGWKQGYKGRTFRILASSGPVITGSGAPAGISRVGISPTDTPIVVQPDDVLGWGRFGEDEDPASVSPTSSSDSVGDAHRDTECLLDLSIGCDDAGLCAFDSPVPMNVSYPDEDVRISVELTQPPHVKRRPHAAPYTLRAGLNISYLVTPETTYEEFMTARQRLDHPALEVFEDKIRLRKELLPEVGVLATPSIHLSNSDTDVISRIRGRRAFVVKPSHMSESQSVFVVSDGINLLQQAWGFPNPVVSLDEIQGAVDRFMGITALDWECRALVGAQPGVIVEDLVLAGPDDAGRMRVDEYKFYTVWGRVVFGESVPFSSGAVMEIGRDGQIITAKVPCPPYCVAPCYSKMVEIAEQVATGARTDFLRVDMLIQGRCDGLFISEVELYPASNFEPQLKALVSQLWRRGYGVG